MTAKAGIRIGINPIAWSNDDLHELGGNIPLEQCLAEASAAGYEGIELGHKFPRDAGVLRATLAPHGLDLVSGWYSSRLLERSVDEELCAVCAHLDLLCALGCEVMVYAEVSGCVHGERGKPLSTRPTMTDAQWTLFAERLQAMASALAERGIRLAYHHHMGTVIESADEVHRLIEGTGPEVGLLLDTGHLAYAGADPVAVARRHAERIVHVHCKDVRPAVLERAKTRDSSFLDAVIEGAFTVPGDGCIDFAGVVAALRETGYAGWVVVEAEQDPAAAHPLTYARMGHEHLVRILTEAGM